MIEHLEHPVPVRRSWRDPVATVLHRRRAVAVELLLVPIVLGLRAAGMIRNPSLLLLIVGGLSLWLRRSGWRAVGLSRPAHVWRTLALGAGIAALYDAFDVFGILPLLKRLTGAAVNVESLGSLQGNAGALLTWLAVTWTFAAFGEELAWRGYVLNRFADLLGRGGGGIVLASVITSLGFGFAHAVQGPAGMIDNVLAGLLFAGVYLASGRNLWLPIVVHGMVDTLSFLLLYMGYRPG